MRTQRWQHKLHLNPNPFESTPRLDRNEKQEQLTYVSECLRHYLLYITELLVIVIFDPDRSYVPQINTHNASKSLICDKAFLAMK